jgi:hypothetical protein
MPQPPQLLLSLRVSTHRAPHIVLGDAHPPSTIDSAVHTPALHTWPLGHAMPQLPQFAGSTIVLTHVVPHIV